MKKIVLIFLSIAATRVIFRFVLGLFFERKFLCGRHFEYSHVGWVWAIKAIWSQKILGFNRNVPWPMTHSSRISNPSNIVFHSDDLDNFQSPGCYFQNFAARIKIGRNTPIGPNVGFITSNHDASNPSEHLPGKDIEVGCNCWIGMNSVILPGVKLGDSTVVGAGSIVTRSFPEGNCVIAGNPARRIRGIN